MPEYFIYSADVYCADCGKAICERLTREGKAPEHPGNQHTYDSDTYPKEVCDAGETDSPQHCATCGKYLEHYLTADGLKYALEAIREYVDTRSGNHKVIGEWADDLASNYTLQGSDRELCRKAIDLAKELQQST